MSSDPNPASQQLPDPRSQPLPDGLIGIIDMVILAGAHHDPVKGVSAITIPSGYTPESFLEELKTARELMDVKHPELVCYDNPLRRDFFTGYQGVLEKQIELDRPISIKTPTYDHSDVGQQKS
jgi:hypothetical protein